MTSARDQEILLVLPGTILEIQSMGDEVKIQSTANPAERRITLAAGRPVSLSLKRKW
jgi:hypothetical protein